MYRGKSYFEWQRRATIIFENYLISLIYGQSKTITYIVASRNSALGISELTQPRRGRRRRRRQRTIINTITARWIASSPAPARSCRENYNVKRPFLELSELRGRNNKNMFIVNISLSAAQKNIRLRKQNPKDPHTEVKSTLD